MYRFTLFLFVFAGLIALNSCRTKKDLTYLADMQNDSLLKNLPAEATDYLLKPNDNVYVNIQSTNDEVTKLFNVNTTTQGGGTQAFTDPSGQAIYGNIIDKTGTITLPVLGKIEIAGLSQAEAQAKVQLKANEYLKEASVKLKMLNFKITMLGEVKAPGVYYFYDNSLNILDALGRAGGFSDMAVLNTVLVMRKTSSGTQSYRLNFKTKNLLSQPGYYLQPNDIVYAEPARMKATQLNFTTFSLVLSTLTFLVVIFKL
jgi:polysaccharide export outer membrane protein